MATEPATNQPAPEPRPRAADPPLIKHTAIAADGFSLLLLRAGRDRGRMTTVVDALRRNCDPLLSDLPFVVAQHLTYDDAIAGQLALVCCDCMSAFVPDRIVFPDNREYLDDLFRRVSRSAEFDNVSVELAIIPPTEVARSFCWKFFGTRFVNAPSTLGVYRKKARFMQQDAVSTGIVLRVRG